MSIRDSILARFDCDPIRGAFIPKHGPFAGSPVISTRSKRAQKYPAINFVHQGQKSLMSCHRAMWIIVHGENPASAIDHINTVAGDYRASNLRLVSQAQNCQNKALVTIRGKILGVTKVSRAKWAASICLDGVRFSLGTFGSEQEAALAYAEAKSRMHFFDPDWHYKRGLYISEIRYMLGSKKEFMGVFGCDKDEYKLIIKSGGFERTDLTKALSACEANGINATYASLIREEKK